MARKKSFVNLVPADIMPHRDCTATISDFVCAQEIKLRNLRSVGLLLLYIAIGYSHLLANIDRDSLCEQMVHCKLK